MKRARELETNPGNGGRNSESMKRARELETMEIVGENGQRQWLLFNLTPFEKRFLRRYREITDRDRQTVNAMFAGFQTGALTTEAAEAFSRTADPLAAAREWAMNTTPEQRVEMERYWSKHIAVPRTPGAAGGAPRYSRNWPDLPEYQAQRQKRTQAV